MEILHNEMYKAGWTLSHDQPEGSFQTAIATGFDQKDSIKDLEKKCKFVIQIVKHAFGSKTGWYHLFIDSIGDTYDGVTVRCFFF